MKIHFLFDSSYLLAPHPEEIFFEAENAIRQYVMMGWPLPAHAEYIPIVPDVVLKELEKFGATYSDDKGSDKYKDFCTAKRLLSTICASVKCSFDDLTVNTETLDLDKIVLPKVPPGLGPDSEVDKTVLKVAMHYLKAGSGHIVALHSNDTGINLLASQLLKEYNGKFCIYTNRKSVGDEELGKTVKRYALSRYSELAGEQYDVVKNIIKKNKKKIIFAGIAATIYGWLKD